MSLLNLDRLYLFQCPLYRANPFAKSISQITEQYEPYCPSPLLIHQTKTLENRPTDTSFKSITKQLSSLLKVLLGMPHPKPSYSIIERGASQNCFWCLENVKETTYSESVRTSRDLVYRKLTMERRRYLDFRLCRVCPGDWLDWLVLRVCIYFEAIWRTMG